MPKTTTEAIRIGIMTTAAALGLSTCATLLGPTGSEPETHFAPPNTTAPQRLYLHDINTGINMPHDLVFSNNAPSLSEDNAYIDIPRILNELQMNGYLVSYVPNLSHSLLIGLNPRGYWIQAIFDNEEAGNVFAMDDFTGHEIRIPNYFTSIPGDMIAEGLTAEELTRILQRLAAGES